ncbi:MAG: hypothetical protein ACKOCT_07735, partial [Alphaproteobacteria bacterium]
PPPPRRRSVPAQAPDPVDDETIDEPVVAAAEEENDDEGVPDESPADAEPAFVATGADQGGEDDDALGDDDAHEIDDRPAPRRRGKRTRPSTPPADEEPTLEEEDGPLLIRETERHGAVDPKRSDRAPRESRSPMRPVLAGVGLVLASFLGLAGLLRRNPDLALERLASIPLLGRLVGDDRLVLGRLQVSGLESTVEKIKGDRSALVVSGRVTNTTGQPLRLIEVEGRLLADGVERRRQVVYAANQMRKTIRDLSASEVEMLLRLEPNRRFVVRPGESATFLLVFPDPPANSSAVDCRIVDARAA